MPNLSANEVKQRTNTRDYIQPGGPRPNNPSHFYGLDAQYMYVGQTTKPNLGTIAPVWAQDPRIPRRYKLIGRTIAPPELGTGNITLTEKFGSVPLQLGVVGCPVNYYNVSGKCRDLSNLMTGWDDVVVVYAGGLVENVRLGQRSSLGDDAVIEDEFSVKWADIYAVGALSFGEQFAAEIDREAVDVVYGSNFRCGDCGPADDGTNRVYAVTKSSGGGSPGLPAELIFTPDGGLTKYQRNIDGMTGTEDPVGVDIAGNLLVVFSATAIYWATINANTGVPSAFTKVTTGLVAGKSLTDVYVLSAKEIFFSALGGYVYKSTDITAGVTALNAGSATTQDLFRIHGDGQDTIVATGAASTVIKSANRGATFAVTTSNPSAIPADFKAVAVRDPLRYWVGANVLGRAYYTLDGGETWAEQHFTGEGAGNVRDIVAPTDEVMYMLFDNNTPTARLIATFNGFADWTMDGGGSQRILNWPVFNVGNRIAFPDVADSTVRVNNLTIVGINGGGVDGIWLAGIASRL